MKPRLLSSLLAFPLWGCIQSIPAATEVEQRKPEALSLMGKPLYANPPAGEAGKKLLQDLEEATAQFVQDPDSADNIIWLGRRLAYLSRYRDAISVYSRGVQKYPADFRMYRHRGHRYISVRDFDRAVADLEKATVLIRGVPDQVEPDGAPNARNIPTSTSHFNIWYHLGLAYYLKGDFENAVRSYRECMKFSTDNPDRLVATSDWLYMTLRRQNRPEEAKEVLAHIHKDLAVIENTAYFERLLMYKGEKHPDSLLVMSDDPVQIATYGYGIANWYLYNGEKERARTLLQKILEGSGWAAFGYIAAEAELAREKRENGRNR